MIIAKHFQEGNHVEVSAVNMHVLGDGSMILTNGEEHSATVQSSLPFLRAFPSRTNSRPYRKR